MSKPRIATVADAVIAEMTAKAVTVPSGWSQAFKISRIYLDRQAKEELNTLQLRVMCGESNPVLLTRKHREWRHTVQIAVRQNVDSSNVDAIDALAAFAQSIAEYWAAGVNYGLRVIAGTQATISMVGFLPYSPDVLDTDRVFNSVITLTIVEVLAT